MKKQLILNEDEIRDIRLQLAELAQQFKTPEDPVFIHNAPVFAHHLPLRVRRFVNDFRLGESDEAAICLISGYPIDDQKIGLTPPNRELKADTLRTLEEQMLLVLCGTLLGEPFGWSTQQTGYLVHDVLPVPGHEYDQMGSSSKEELSWHTEDAFHPYRCDYLGLMCLRNPDQVATSVASNRVLSRLSERQIRTLFEPRFTIRPDESHFKNHQPASHGSLSADQVKKFLRRSYNKINKMNTAPEPIPVLFGDPTSPYMRVDSLYLEGLDEEAESAVRAIINALANELTDVVLQAGDICFIDNYRTIHGRRAFTARYDGTDRWLKRVNITRDIRKSRDMRMTGASRIIF